MADRSKLFVGVGVWMAVSTAVRLPVAMAPLLLVLLVNMRFGTYDAGPAVVGAFVVGELIGAAVAALIQPTRLGRTRLIIGLCVSATALSALTKYEAISLALIVSLAFMSGAGGAGAPGAMQATLLSSVPEASVTRVIAAVRIQSALVFMVAPVAVSFLVASGSIRAALFIMVCASLLGAAGVWFLKANLDKPALGTSPAAGLLAVARAWPIYLGGLAATFVIGIGDMLVTPFWKKGAHRRFGRARFSPAFSSPAYSELSCMEHAPRGRHRSVRRLRR